MWTIAFMMMFMLLTLAHAPWAAMMFLFLAFLVSKAGRTIILSSSMLTAGLALYLAAKLARKAEK